MSRHLSPSAPAQGGATGRALPAPRAAVVGPTASPLLRAALLSVFVGALGLVPAAWTDWPSFVSAAYADDGGGDGGDGGDGGGGDGGGGDVDYEPPEEAPAVDAETFIADEILALNPSAAALQRASALGATVIERIDTPSLGVRLVRLRVPAGLDAKTARQILRERDPDTFDLHHLYRIAQSAPARNCSGAGCDMLQLIGWPADARSCGRNQAIGIVDTAVAVDHPALAGANLESRSFIDRGQQAGDSEHGTAVAALLVGRSSSGFPGLVPQARLLAAAPFYTLESGTVTADAAGLVQSLDWLAASGARVIGLSLAGPHNLGLDAAVRQAATRGIVIAAAAGNGGRNAPPAYPAAFDRVLGVTAISEDRRVYWRANQGDYVDYALPGVNVWTVDGAGGKRRSGTSFAVPFMVGLASQALAQRALNRDQLLNGQVATLVDLGAPGRDPVFGWGKPRFDGACR